MINKTWIFLFSVVILGAASVSSLTLDEDEEPDYWDDFEKFLQDYDNYGDIGKVPEINNDDNKSIFEETKEILNKDNEEDDKIEAIQEDGLMDSNPVEQLPESDDNVQIWREIKDFKDRLEDEQVNTDDDDSDDDDSDEADIGSIESNEENISNEDIENESDENDGPENEENKAIFEETKEILNNDNEEDGKIEAIPEDDQNVHKWRSVKNFKDNLGEQPVDTDDNHNEDNADKSDEGSIDTNKDTQDKSSLEKPEIERITSKETHAEQDSDENESDENVEQSNDGRIKTEDTDEIIGEPDVLVTKSKLEKETKNRTETKKKLADDDDDTVAKVVADLKEDFNDLFETMNKLAEDDDIAEQDYVIEPNEDPSDKLEKKKDVSNEDVIGYEEKYGKPFREDNILAMRQDYEYIEDSNLGSIFADDNSEESLDTLRAIFSSENTKDKPESPKINSELIQNIEESIISAVETQDSNVNKDEKTTQTITIKGDNDEEYVNDQILMELDPNMFNRTWVENKFKDIAENINKSTLTPVNTESKEATEKPQLDDEVETKKSIPFKSINVGDLSPAQYNDLMVQFQEAHKTEFDTQSEDFSTHVAPIHMSLHVDEPLEITSPNYPNNYPTNNIVDWIFDGEGIGIEFNITDFAVNGVLGDYLLVKPGGADETGHTGLIFSYQLREERNYRFLDVDRMFVRFESKPGLGFNRGFKFSVKMIAPLPEEPEPEPTPQPILPTPPSTLTINVGGLTASQFLSIREEFRQLIADMATMYINANLVKPGLNETSDVTQITSVAVCNINWPNFENCVEVTFGVPVVYEDEETSRLDQDDLLAMWNTYIYQDPFALRLRRLGITEFAAPNDQRTMLLWLVIAAAVLISTGMLAFGLWRYSCFQNYTRMSPYSDTDSIVDAKRGLDLYPTPHQTLPPLFSDQDLKWDDKFDSSARVDMTGYNNTNYVRDELYGFESDEDVISPRDRNSAVGFSPRDMYKV